MGWDFCDRVEGSGKRGAGSGGEGAGSGNRGGGERGSNTPLSHPTNKVLIFYFALVFCAKLVGRITEKIIL